MDGAALGRDRHGARVRRRFRGTLLAATYSDPDDTTALVLVDEQGRASVVARIGANRSDPESDGRVLAMAHDAAHEVVWLAGGFGVAAFAVA